METIDGIGSDIKKEGPVEAAYPGTPLAAGLSLFEAVAVAAGDFVQLRTQSLGSVSVGFR